MPMKYKNLFLVFLGLLSIFKVSPCLADGCFMSSEQLHLYSPEQKAIVTWDGKTEQMVLASKVQADKISNMVWIIPIQSRIKPEVQKSDFSIFKDLISFCGEKDDKPHLFGRNQLSGKGIMEGVEVVETKKIDIYDIAILKATSANDLLQWLNTNGYQVSEGAKSIIEKYIQRSSMYFVANKIDLHNKFSTDVQQALDFYERMKQWLEQKRQANEEELNKLRNAQAENCSSWQRIEGGVAGEKEFSACVIEKVKTRFQQTGKFVTTISPDPHYPNNYMFSLDDHWIVTFVGLDSLSNSYFFIRYDNRMVLTDMFPSRQERDLRVMEYFPAAIGQEAITYADMIRVILAKELAFRKDLEGHKKESTKDTKDLDMILSVLSQQSQSSFFCSFRNFFPSGDRQNIVLEAASGISPKPEIEKTDYCQTIAALQAGMATPLKITFQPDTPYYPLEISSLGEGSAMIDIYVIADSAVNDHNKAFQEVKSFALNGVLKGKIIKEFQSGPWVYVTRFSWRGRLKDLKKDAVFLQD